MVDCESKNNIGSFLKGKKIETVKVLYGYKCEKVEDGCHSDVDAAIEICFSDGTKLRITCSEWGTIEFLKDIE